MSGRVKRTPLFGADGLLGIQGLGNNNNKNNNDIMQVSAGELGLTDLEFLDKGLFIYYVIKFGGGGLWEAKV